MELQFGSRPMAVHVPFHQSAAKERAMFGAFGSGKTYAIIDESIAWCLEQPGIRGVIIRKTAPELRDTVEPIFRERMPAALWAAGEERRSGGHMESFTFPNGSKVLFRSLDDWNKHRSLNVGFIAYDEANEIDEESYDGMKSRVRQRDLTAEATARGYTGQITRRGIWLATNPAGEDWLWERFINNPKEDTAYFKSTSLDNPYLPPEYIDSLLQYPEPWIRRYVLCSFDDFAGSIYPEWGWDTHVVKPYESYDRSNVFWMGMDPGTRNPTAGLWVYVDRKAQCLVGVKEYQENRTAAIQHAARWREIEAELKGPVRWRTADPNIMTPDRGSNNTLHSQYARMGYHFQLGPRTHKVRIPALGQLIVLGRFKVTEDCPRTYEQIKRYRWEDITPAQRAKGTEPREQPVKKDEHLVDCAQYLACRWLAPNKLALPSDGDFTEHEKFSQDVHRILRKKRLKGRRKSRQHDLGGLAV